MFYQKVDDALLIKGGQDKKFSQCWQELDLKATNQAVFEQFENENLQNEEKFFQKSDKTQCENDLTQMKAEFKRIDAAFGVLESRVKTNENHLINHEKVFDTKVDEKELWDLKALIKILPDRPMVLAL